VTPPPDHVERFRALAARRFGLQFDDTKLGWLGDVLQRRADSRRFTVDAYLAAFESAPVAGEAGALATELTVGETYFFRNMEQFNALREQVLPDRLRAQASRRSLRILSAGCASGEEPYSIAMSLCDLLPDRSWQLSIRAVDLNPAAIEKALRGRYTSWSLRETPQAMQQRWFRPDGRDQLLDETLRRAVTFEVRNLHDDDCELWQPGAYDVVFCRNVLMYFTPQSAGAVVARIARSLAPGGALFLGHAETLRGLSQDFHLCHTHSCFYYRSRGAGEARTTPSAPAVAAPALVAALDGGDAWVQAIEHASQRVRALTTPPSSAQRRASTQAPAGWHLGHALELLGRERFAEALELVHGLPPESAQDPDVLLLHAVLLVHGGRLMHAEDTCRRLLALDELNAGAHYVLALCCEAAGDTRGAVDQDQVAVYLDPAFAMPRLHLGLLARRAGDRDTSRREFEQARTLLLREDASRLLLFGGGFGREALLALCEAELQAEGLS
jgi:chemotaxis protein methyltransferase CheR